MITKFTYSVYSTGLGFTTFYHCFQKGRMLSLAEIEFIVQCKMEDDSACKKDGKPMELVNLVIRAGE